MADDVRKNVRNRVCHFNESDWTQIFFDQCFEKLKNLVRGLPLLNVMEKKKLLNQLSEWKAKGLQTTGKKYVKELMAQFQIDRLKDIQEKLEDKPTREEIKRLMQKLSDAVESHIIGAKNDSTPYGFWVSLKMCTPLCM